MFENEWFPKVATLGVSWQEFWSLNPHIIKCLSKAHMEKKIEQDAMVHAWVGSYFLSAVSVAIEHCFSGKKAQSKYIEQPIMAEIQQKIQEEKPLTEEEKKKQTEMLFLKLELLGANHKLANKGRE